MISKDNFARAFKDILVDLGKVLGAEKHSGMKS